LYTRVLYISIIQYLYFYFLLTNGIIGLFLLWATVRMVWTRLGVWQGFITKTRVVTHPGTSDTGWCWHSEHIMWLRTTCTTPRQATYLILKCTENTLNAFLEDLFMRDEHEVQVVFSGSTIDYYMFAIAMSHILTLQI